MTPEEITAWLAYARYFGVLLLISALVFSGHIDVNTGLGAALGILYPLSHTVKQVVA